MATGITLAPPPTDTPLFDLPPEKEPAGRRTRYVMVHEILGIIKKQWSDWLIFAILNRVQQTANFLTVVKLPAGSVGSVGSTQFPVVGQLQAGLYRVHWRARITQAATVSSSLTVAIGSTTGGVPVTDTGAAITGNTTTTVQSGTVILRSDGGAAPITYQLTYATNGATPMQYQFDATLEFLSS